MFNRFKDNVKQFDSKDETPSLITVDALVTKN